jgi:hypothetical protein
MPVEELEEWGAFVRTGWGAAALRQRLAEGARIVRVWDSLGGLRGTCVVRPRQPKGLWLLETLVARPQRAGWGAATMHAAVRAVWELGGMSIGFQWELTARGLLRAWWSGWLGAAISIERGWVWMAPQVLEQEQGGTCGFCPNTAAWLPERPPPLLPVVVSGAVVSDSGLWDGWGYVLAATGEVDWPAVAAVAGWRHLWFTGPVAPAGAGWRWSGEVVVRGVLNKGVLDCAGVVSPLAWITAEVSSGS